MKCIICSKPLTGKQTKFCSLNCKNADVNRKTKSYLQQQIRATNLKIKMVKLKGGACSICGYKKNLAALHFHHLQNKNFELDARNMANRSEQVLNKELDKCILVCSNCHMELHYPHMAV